ncbi:MAG TPA: M13 family metallopeptidase N-terminal domain-containing protein, partial [Polyangiaceae bacterium]|nr:M13 family metallopeptidase N-terminal domain-containing protein [Polyangiaceae bacterium]
MPSLRRLSKKWPYLTNGSAPDLGALLDAVRFGGPAGAPRFYHQGAPPEAGLAELGRGEKEALLAFLGLLLSAEARTRPARTTPTPAESSPATARPSQAPPRPSALAAGVAFCDACAMRFRLLTPFARRPLALAALALAACSSPSAPTATRPPPPPEAAPPAPAPDRPKAQIGAWGFDGPGMDRSVSPGQNFYQHANGTWQRTTPIPADKSNYGMFTALGDLSDERTRKIIEEAAGQGGAAGEAQQVGDFYKSFMDEAAVEAAGITPLRAELDAINAIKNVEGLVARFAADARALAGGPFVAAVYQDARRPETHVAHLAQGGLGLPDRDM